MSIIKYKKVFHIFIVSFFSFSILYTNLFQKESIKVNGKVIIISGNTMPTTTKHTRSEKIKNSRFKIIAIPGKIKRIKDQISIPITKIPFNSIIKETNYRGEFSMNVPKGRYTFFILHENEAIRNSFDGKGFFTHTEVKKDIKNLSLIYDKFAIY